MFPTRLLQTFTKNDIRPSLSVLERSRVQIHFSIPSILDEGFGHLLGSGQTNEETVGLPQSNAGHDRFCVCLV